MCARTGLIVAAATTLAALPLVYGGAAHAATPTCGGLPATIIGTPGRADFLTGNAGPDVVYLGYGNDRFDGQGGDDVICGGAGNDTIRGGEGNDTIYGEDGNDVIRGDAGDDTVSTGAGRNTVIDGAGDDTLRGGPGTDRLSYFSAGTYQAASVHIDAIGGTATGYGADTLTRFEKYDLTRSADTFRGREVSEFVDSRGGDDTITTAGGNDVVWVGAGATRVSAGSGNDDVSGYGNRGTRISLGDGDDSGGTALADVISGGAGNDFLRTYFPGSRLEGGAGSDTVAGSIGKDRRTGALIDLATQKAHIIGQRHLWYLGSIENAWGNSGDDRIFGTQGDNVLKGYGGDDYINGRGGNDSLSGGDGDDTIVR
jgi:Ca2+-binding RTX toxin-like protein